MDADEVQVALKGIAKSAHSQKREHCGFIGYGNGDDWHVFPMRNVTTEGGDRYEIDHTEQAELFQSLQTSGVRLWGVYHTHIESPHPSPTDTHHWSYPPQLRMVIATPDAVSSYVYLSEEGLVIQPWPR